MSAGMLVSQQLSACDGWENDETGSRVNGPRSLTNHLNEQEVG